MDPDVYWLKSQARSKLGWAFKHLCDWTTPHDPYTEVRPQGKLGFLTKSLTKARTTTRRINDTAPLLLSSSAQADNFKGKALQAAATRMAAKHMRNSFRKNGIDLDVASRAGLEAWVTKK
jgi:hypothetical protein